MRRSLASGSRARASHASRARAGRSRQRQSKWAGSTRRCTQNGAGNSAVSVWFPIERVDKGIHLTNGVALLDPLIEAYRQQYRLSAIGTLNEALHKFPPVKRQAKNSRQLVVTQPRRIAS